MGAVRLNFPASIVPVFVEGLISSKKDEQIANPLVFVRMPPDQTPPNSRPGQCPHCGSRILQRWGRVSKTIQDTLVRQAVVHRYRCTECARTFRAYPDGLDRGSRSLRLRRLAALAWRLGLSLDSVVDIFSSLGIQLSRSSIWRYGRARMEDSDGPEENRYVSLLGVNKRISPEDLVAGVTLLVLDLGGRQWVALEVVDEAGPWAARSWLFRLAQEFGLEATITAKN